MAPDLSGTVGAEQRRVEEAYARGLREGTKAPVTVFVEVYTPTGEPVVLNQNTFDVVDGATVRINLSEAPRYRKEIEDYVRHQREEGRAAYYRGDPLPPHINADWLIGYNDARAGR